MVLRNYYVVYPYTDLDDQIAQVDLVLAVTITEAVESLSEQSARLLLEQAYPRIFQGGILGIFLALDPEEALKVSLDEGVITTVEYDNFLEYRDSLDDSLDVELDFYGDTDLPACHETNSFRKKYYLVYATGVTCISAVTADEATQDVTEEEATILLKQAHSTICEEQIRAVVLAESPIVAVVDLLGQGIVSHQEFLKYVKPLYDPSELDIFWDEEKIGRQSHEGDQVSDNSEFCLGGFDLDYWDSLEDQLRGR